MKSYVRTTSQEFWFRPALQKAQTILAEGIVPLPEHHYQQRFKVEEVRDKISNQIQRSQILQLSTDLSVISEGLVCNLINQGLLFGKTARAVKTNQYDDYINHVDLFVNFLGGPVRHLAIDVTYSATLLKKFNRLRRNIASGKLATISYLDAEGNSSEKVPAILLGISHQNLARLAKLWVDQPAELANNQMVANFQLQIKMQLKNYQAYAQAKGREEIACIFKELHSQLCNSITSNPRRRCLPDKISSLIITESILTGLSTAR